MIVALLVGLGIGLGMFALMAALAVPLQRWVDTTGAYGDKPQAPLGSQLKLMALLCVGCGLGGGFLLAAEDGRDWAKPAGYGMFAVTLAAVALLGFRQRRAARPRHVPASEDGPPFTGFARLVHCTIPSMALNNGR